MQHGLQSPSGVRQHARQTHHSQHPTVTPRQHQHGSRRALRENCAAPATQHNMPQASSCEAQHHQQRELHHSLLTSCASVCASAMLLGLSGLPAHADAIARAMPVLQTAPAVLHSESLSSNRLVAMAAPDPASSNTLPDSISTAPTTPTSTPDNPSTPASTPDAPAFCQPSALSAVFSRFATDPTADSFDGAGSVAGLITYYKRLGCTQKQIDAAVQSAYGELVRPKGGAAPSLPVGAWPTYLWQLSIAAVAAFAIRSWQDRPQGWVAGDLVEARPSPVAGTGLFARVDIVQGTVLGAYPGRVRPAAEMRQKLTYAPKAAGYAFLTRDGQHYLDPTDSNGDVSEWPGPGLPWPLPMPTQLAYANEPPRNSGGTSCFVEDGEGEWELLFVANRDIRSGEEIYIDYGLKYDRSGYGSGQ